MMYLLLLQNCFEYEWGNGGPWQIKPSDEEKILDEKNCDEKKIGRKKTSEMN